MNYYNYDLITFFYVSTTESPMLCSTTISPDFDGLQVGDIPQFDIPTQTWMNVTDPAAEPLSTAKARGRAAVLAAFPGAVDAWVASGDTYAYLPSDILSIQQNRTTTADVTVQCKLLASPYTESTAVVNDSAFKVIAVAIMTARNAVATTYNGYLADIAAAETVETVNAVISLL